MTKTNWKRSFSLRIVQQNGLKLLTFIQSPFDKVLRLNISMKQFPTHGFFPNILIYSSHYSNVVQLKGKHFLQPHCRNGVVQTLGFCQHCLTLSKSRIPMYVLKKALKCLCIP